MTAKIEKKVAYDKERFYYVGIRADEEVVVKEGDMLKKDQIIASPSSKPKDKGGTKKIGTNAVSRKPLFNKVAPFDAKVEKVMKAGLLLNFPAITVNLVCSKGNSVVGDIQYIPSRKFEKNPKPVIKKGTIVVTDTITKELYAIMSTMGAIGIIANSVDYLEYKDIIILAVPLGIISGFGYLSEDAKLSEQFVKMDGKRAWLDTVFDRLVIPEKSEPRWVREYKFDLEAITEIR